MRASPAPSVREASSHVRSTRLEPGLRLAQVERRGDERERDDHARGGQHELHARVLDQAAEHAVRSQRGEQADARDRRRQHERQLDERDDRRPAAEPARGQ